MKKILLSGVQPTGRPHIGNYFGAMKQFVESQNSDIYDCLVMIADFHALNFIQDKSTMKTNTFNLACDYLAIGLDPEKTVIFKQSDIPAHTELTWIFDTLVTVPYLERAHAFKNAENKNKEISVGTFNYPVLMASDILLYDTDVVPVGQDQKQHLEYARDIAQKFNNTYGETFKMPEPLILEHVSTVPGVDGQKMSKSYNNTIPLFSDRDEIVKLVMSIVTDSGGDVPTNVYAIHKLLKTESELKPLYESNKGKYKALKEALIEDLDIFIKPFREKRAEILKNDQYIIEVLKKGAERAGAISENKMKKIRELIGVR